MNIKELSGLFQKANKRMVLVGTAECGVAVGLDLEGRLYFVYENEVVSRVNPDSILGISDRSAYKNPGGDGLWPAPEGTCFGYEYPTGNWEVPIGLVNSRFQILEERENFLSIEAEVPLINANLLGVPTIFRRSITLVPGKKMSVEVIESIEYTGNRKLNKGEFLLSPWSLCQFDWKKGDYFSFKADKDLPVRDLYTSSADYRKLENGEMICRPTEDKRYQIALGDEVELISLHLKSQNLLINRYLEPSSAGKYVDIADAPTTEKPLDKGVKFSFYNDPSHFLEIEGAGTCTETLEPNQKLTVKITTTIER